MVNTYHIHGWFVEEEVKQWTIAKGNLDLQAGHQGLTFAHPQIFQHKKSAATRRWMAALFLGVTSTIYNLTTLYWLVEFIFMGISISSPDSGFFIFISISII